MHKASDNQDDEMIDLLIDQGAYWNPKNKNNLTPSDLLRKRDNNELANYVDATGARVYRELRTEVRTLKISFAQMQEQMKEQIQEQMKAEMEELRSELRRTKI